MVISDATRKTFSRSDLFSTPSFSAKSIVASEVSTGRVLSSKSKLVQPFSMGKFNKPVAKERKESYGKYRILKLALIEKSYFYRIMEKSDWVVMKNGHNNLPNIPSLRFVTCNCSNLQATNINLRLIDLNILL